MWYLKNYDELTKEEVVAIYKARIETFIVGQDLNYQEIDDTDKESWHLFEMNDAGEVISYLRIIPEEDRVSLGRVLIDKLYRGKGKGRALLERAKEVCKEWFVDNVIEVHAQAQLQELYESLGFEVVSEPYDIVGIKHVTMELY
jgi:hypothetical protein